MGWRDINMSRRNPQPRRAFVPVEPGEDLDAAVLRKAASQAVSCLSGQGIDTSPEALRPFLAGYLLGHARQVALKLGVDCEEAINDLVAEMDGSIPPDLRPGLAAIRFAPRPAGSVAPRAKLRADEAVADAGYLVGHLESLCGTRKLARLAGERLTQTGVETYLTDCDVAADPLQTREPTKSLRLTIDERAVIRRAFAALA